jgi:PAS domain S-box-containing protein
MTIKAAAIPAEYAIRRDTAEALPNELLAPSPISLFRDSQSLSALQEHIREKLTHLRAHSEIFRIWIPACATGEGLYSLAIIMAEELGPKASASRVQILGTDILESAIDYCSRGVYPKAAFSVLSPERFKRFFIKVDGGYRVIQTLRALCTFAQHDLATCAPVQDMDLIVCRDRLANLGIRDRALAAFESALKPAGLLFTGPSHLGVGAFGRFRLLDPKHGIFKLKVHQSISSQPQRAGPAISLPSRAPRLKVAAGKESASLQQELQTAHAEMKASSGAKPVSLDEVGRRTRELNLLAGDFCELLMRTEIPVVVLDSQLRIRRFTHEAALLFALTSSHIGQLFNPASSFRKTNWDALFRAAIRSGHTIKRSLQHRNGRRYFVRIIPLREARTAKYGVLVALVHDDLNRTLMDRGSETVPAAHVLLDTSPQAIIAADLHGQIVWANRATAGLFGYETLELAGRPVECLVPEVLREQHLAGYKRYFAKRRHASLTLRVEGKRKDGTLFPIEVNVSVVDTPSGEMGVAFVTDLTERQNLDRAIQQRDQALAVLFDNLPDPVVRFDANLRPTHVNRAFERITGIPPHKAIGKTGSELRIPKATVDLIDPLIRRVFQTGKPTTTPYSYPTPGGVRDFEGVVIPEIGPDGSVSAVFTIARDITEKKRAEDALRERERELALLFDNSPDVILRLDRNLRNLYINATWEAVTGVRREKAIGKTSRELGLPQAVVELQERVIRRVLRTKRPVTVEFSYPSPTGPVDHEVRHIPEFGPDGRIRSVLLIGRDITDQRRLLKLAESNAEDIRALSARLINAQEEERRRVARDIHDSLCQHLGTLAAELGGIAAELPSSSPAGERVRLAQARAISAAQEAHHLAYQLHPAILDDLGLEAALQLLCDEFARYCDIEVRFRVRSKPGAIRQNVASCVYRIAQEALSNVAKHAHARHVFVRLTTGLQVSLLIRDDGVGFDQAAMQRAGQLGLSSMQERARIVGGKLSIRAKIGRGVRVELIVPQSGKAE